MKQINLIAQRFGMMTVLQKHHTDGHRVFWLCECDCGTRFVRSTDNINSRKDRVQSCGCYRPNRGDIIGQRFGKLVVLSQEHKRGNNGEVKWLCQCDCGNTTIRTTGNLQSGKDKNKSCGCFVIENAKLQAELNRGRFIDLTGTRFGRLTAIQKVGMDGNQSIWLCQCDCGNTVIRKIGTLNSNRAKHGQQSCGCLNRERMAEIGHQRGFTGWLIGKIVGYGPNWKEQRKRARIRDNYTCQSCGTAERNRAHDVHHIVPFKQWHSWQDANKLDNLVTLCRDCHKKHEPR